MDRRETSWYADELGIEMPLVAYGHAGPPLLMFPTAAADYLEYERFHLVDAIAPLIEAGRLRAYAINSVNRHSLLNEEMPNHLKTLLLTAYDRYVLGQQYCPSGEVARGAGVPTVDKKYCPVRKCVESEIFRAR